MSNPYPYDKDGYCVHCRVAQYKPHATDCSYREAVEKASGPKVVDAAPIATSNVKPEVF